MEQPIFRIRAINYRADGCYVVVNFQHSLRSHQFKLDVYCHHSRWLKNFSQSDLDIIWQLVYREHTTVSSWRLVLCYIFIKFYKIKHTLKSWEDEPRATVTGRTDDFEDW